MGRRQLPGVRRLSGLWRLSHSDSANAATPTFVLEKGRFATNLYVPGELIAFQQVNLDAKVNSFVKKLYVDVGSEVREGDLLATMEAPELQSQLSSAESKMKSQEAVYIASKANYDRVVEPSKTLGTISQNDIDQADARQKSDYASGMPPRRLIVKWRRR